MAKYTVSYLESAKYTLTVNADNEDEAIALAHDILLGDDEHDGAIRIAEPFGVEIDCDVTETEWGVE